MHAWKTRREKFEKKKAAKTQGEKREIFVFTDYWNDHIIKPTKVEWQRVCVSECACVCVCVWGGGGGGVGV